MSKMKCLPRISLRFLLLCMVLLTALWARPAHALFGGPVIDSSNLAENVRQLISIMQQMQQLATQLSNQDRMLQSLGVDATVGQRTTLNKLTDPMQSTAMRSQLPHVIHGQLENQYPLSRQPLTSQHIQATRQRWLQTQRIELDKWQQLTQRVQEDMPLTAQRVSRLIEASNGKRATPNGKPGTTAALQARNQLQAIAAAETNKLTALRIMRMKVRAENRAREQAQMQLANQQSQKLRQEWIQPTTVKPVRPAF